jgi:hypothetical protein
MQLSNNLVKVGSYAYARELANGEWSIYVGEWSAGKGHVKGLKVQRDAGKPLRFVSLEAAKEYTQYLGL